MDKSRYSRYGGWRRDNCCKDECYKNPECHFGFGGPNQGGFGRYGKFGGYRSFYNYRDPNNIACIKNENTIYTNISDNNCYNDMFIATMLMMVILIYLFI
jgi:hypothetical protein